MNEGKPNIEEITLSIALLGGIIIVLLKVIDYFSNNSIDLEASFKPTVIGVVTFLLIELLIIFLFFIFKGISIYTNNIRSEDFKHISGDLFKLSFIVALVWFIDSIIMIGLKYFFSVTGSIWYFGIVVISFIIVILYSKPEFKTSNKIIFVFFIVMFIIFAFIIDLIAVPYLLTGSYSIEEFSPSIDDHDMRTFTMKEKGISYKFNEVWLYKLNSSLTYDSNKPGLDCTNRPGFSCIDNVIIYRNGTYRNGTIRDGDNAICSKYIFGEQINQAWYINIINISNLTSGTYLLNAKVKDEPNNKTMPFGDSKRFAEKMFYISPEKAKANYSFFNCTQTP